MKLDNASMELYQLKAEIIQAAAHPLRLAIIDFLSQGEQCVCDITEHVDAQRSNVSRHLSLMLKSGILECRKEGLKVIYSLRTPCILNFLSCVNNVLKEKMASQAAVLAQLGKT